MVADDAPSNANKGAMTRLHINSGVLYTKSGIPIRLSRATARIANGMKGSGGPKKQDNDIVFLDSGVVSLSDDSLTKLLQSKVEGKGIEDLHVTSDKGQIKISGKMKKVVSVPVTIEGPATATPDGKIELHTKTEKASVLPIKGLADALGMSVNKVVGNKAKGVKAEGDNAIIFDPDELWGLPIHGFVTQVTVQKNGITLHFGAPQQHGGTRVASER